MDHNEKLSRCPRRMWNLLNIVQSVSMNHDSISSALLQQNIFNHAWATNTFHWMYILHSLICLKCHRNNIRTTPLEFIFKKELKRNLVNHSLVFQDLQSVSKTCGFRRWGREIPCINLTLDLIPKFTRRLRTSGQSQWWYVWVQV